MLQILVLTVCFFWTRNVDAQGLQTCTCVPSNSCYQNLQSSDGTGVIDIRIVNSGTIATVPPGTVTNCPAGQDRCCTGVTGCGVRWNIPPTPTTTPGPGQAKYGSQPWQAVILTTGNAYVGGGILLDSITVLTAAHKVANMSAATIKVRLGDWNLNQDVEPYKYIESLVVQIRMHPNFSPSNRNNLTNDVAILRLVSPIPSGPSPSPAINTACLPNAATNFDNQRCLVAGWGENGFSGPYQSIMREVDVPIVPNAVCQDRLRATRLGSNFVLNTNSFICAGGEAGKDACVGDGGSGLVCFNGGKYEVVGLVDWGIGCGSANVPGVYVRVQSFLQWITQNRV